MSDERKEAAVMHINELQRGEKVSKFMDENKLGLRVFGCF